MDNLHKQVPFLQTFDRMLCVVSKPKEPKQSIGYTDIVRGGKAALSLFSLPGTYQNLEVGKLFSSELSF